MRREGPEEEERDEDAHVSPAARPLTPEQLVALLASPLDAQVKSAVAMLSPEPGGPEFDIEGVTFHIGLAVARADVAAHALAAVDRCWRLAIGLAALPTSPPPTIEELLADPQQAGLIIVASQTGSLEFVVKPLKSAKRVVKEKGVVIVATTAIALAQGPATAEWYIHAFTGGGAKCAQVQPPRPPATHRQWIGEPSFHLPAGASLGVEATADNAARVAVHLPARQVLAATKPARREHS